MFMLLILCYAGKRNTRKGYLLNIFRTALLIVKTLDCCTDFCGKCEPPNVCGAIIPTNFLLLQTSLQTQEKQPSQ